MDLREQIRIAIGGALAAQEGSDGAADAVLEVLAKQPVFVWYDDETGETYTPGSIDDGALADRLHESLQRQHKVLMDTGGYAHAEEQSAPSFQEGWLRAIDEALVVTHLGVANAGDSYEDAKRKLNELICWHVDVAADPAVNGGFKLVPADAQPAPSVPAGWLERGLTELENIRNRLDDSTLMNDKTLIERLFIAMTCYRDVS